MVYVFGDLTFDISSHAFLSKERKITDSSIVVGSADRSYTPYSFCVMHQKKNKNDWERTKSKFSRSIFSSEWRIKENLEVQMYLQIFFGAKAFHLLEFCIALLCLCWSCSLHTKHHFELAYNPYSEILLYFWIIQEVRLGENLLMLFYVTKYSTRLMDFNHLSIRLAGRDLLDSKV